MVRLSEGEKKWQLVGLGIRDGWSQDDMVIHFHVSQSTVSKLLRKAGVHGYVKDHPGSGLVAPMPMTMLIS